MTSNVKHSSKNDSWMTPLVIINKSLEVLEHVDLDPATSVEVNSRIKASNILTREEDGLIAPRPKGLCF